MTVGKKSRSERAHTGDPGPLIVLKGERIWPFNPLPRNGERIWRVESVWILGSKEEENRWRQGRFGRRRRKRRIGGEGEVEGRCFDGRSEEKKGQAFFGLLGIAEDESTKPALACYNGL